MPSEGTVQEWNDDQVTFAYEAVPQDEFDYRGSPGLAARRKSTGVARGLGGVTAI
jgi:hypothetical protein